MIKLFLYFTFFMMGLASAKELSPFVSNTPNQMHYFYVDNIEFRYYQPDLSQEDIRIFWKDSADEPYASLDNLIAKQKEKGEELLFAMNGGIYSDDATPGGLYIEDYKLIKDVNLNRGKDNFHTKPNGIFYMQDDIPYIVKSENFQYNTHISMGIQSGPLLMNDGQIYNHFTNASTSEYIRNGVCIDAHNKLYFVQSLNPSNMYRFAKGVQGQLACQKLLYLDGFLSHMQAAHGENKGTQFRPFVSIIATIKKKPK
ncbi:MAG: phosphodiester glycosidase family protein [Alphaproteobacteria bacterium]